MDDKEKQYLIDGLLELLDDYRYQIEAKEKAYKLANKRLELLKLAAEHAYQSEIVETLMEEHLDCSKSDWIEDWINGLEEELDATLGRKGQ